VARPIKGRGGERGEGEGKGRRESFDAGGSIHSGLFLRSHARDAKKVKKKAKMGGRGGGKKKEKGREKARVLLPLITSNTSQARGKKKILQGAVGRKKGRDRPPSPSLPLSHSYQWRRKSRFRLKREGRGGEKGGGKGKGGEKKGGVQHVDHSIFRSL